MNEDIESSVGISANEQKNTNVSRVGHVPGSEINQCNQPGVYQPVSEPALLFEYPKVEKIIEVESFQLKRGKV
jgi:hypothetical protein